ncbi:hypothetical protein [Pseudomaricurvus alkylphenolicus]|uniref:hypothetical protein n=1 Tax=Pseudomaricurvus alkylphenolicus TaxID=1306991 RepID=UPI0030B8E625
MGWDIDELSLYLFAENLLDDDAEITKPIATFTESTMQQPRTVGVTLRTRF